MIRVRSTGDDLLVPIADRMRYLQVFRLGMVAVAGVYWLLAPAYRGLPAIAVGLVSVAYLALSLTGTRIWRLRRDLAVAVSGVTLLADGVYLALVAYSPGQSLTPFRYLAIVDIITVTLLASFRTGLKMAMWHTLLLWLDFQWRGTMLPGAAHTAAATTGARPTIQVALFTAVLGLSAVTTAAFGAVNERELRRHGLDMRALARLGLRLEQVTRPTEVAATVVDALAGDFALDRVLLLEVQEGRVTARAAATARAGQVAAEPVPDGDAGGDELVAHVLRTGRIVLVGKADAERDPWLAGALPSAVNLGLVPLNADGRVIGVICFVHGLRRGSRMEQRVLSMVERFAAHASLALANANLLQKVVESAATDGLTGAANRRAFDERLRHECELATSRGTPVSLVLMDIDHFKKINDTHGHQTGDEVLRQVVKRTRSRVRPDDLTARYGGEEFALLLPATSIDEACELAERVRQEVAAHPVPVPATVSLGVASWHDGMESPDALVAAADQALYRAKQTGRDRVVRHQDLVEATAIQ